MYVTEHARSRIAERVGERAADEVARYLESADGEYGTVAYLLPSDADVLVAIAVDGSVETVYWRRPTQDLSPAYFGAHKVYDKRAPDARYAKRLDKGRTLMEAASRGEQQRRLRRRKVRCA